MTSIAGRLGETTWPQLGDPFPAAGIAPEAELEAADAEPLPGAPVIVLPLGSCEQHGPHLPLDTDTRIAVALADRLVACRPGLLAAPPLSFGASWEHHGFPGLLSINAPLLADVLVELARSAEWAAGIVLVNGHGGNHAGVREAIERITFEGRRAMAWSPRIEGGDAHAGRTETSLLLALDPTLVRLGSAAAGHTGALGAVLHAGVAAVSPNGVLGDPAGASAVEGEKLLEALSRDLVEAVDRWRA